MKLTPYQKELLKLGLSDKKVCVSIGRAIGKTYIYKLLKSIKEKDND